MVSKDKEVSDEVRRKNAEDMILKIAAMMDLGDEDDDEEDGDDEIWEKLKNGDSTTWTNSQKYINTRNNQHISTYYLAERNLE